MSKNTSKTYTRRDSATGYLRAAGINKADYDNYITKRGDSEFTISLNEAGDPVAKPKTLADELRQAAFNSPAAKKAAAKASAKAVKPAKTAPAKERAPSVASVARDLILAGKSNEEVFKQLQKQFKLPDSKKSYPGWYRSDCRRKGLIK